MTVRVGAPGAATVIVPVLDTFVVLAVALILKEPLPERLAGVTLDIVSHAALLVGAFHVVLEDTLTVAVLAADDGFQVEVDRLSVADAAACVTAMVRVGAPGAVAVRVPVLAAVPVLAVTFILNEPLFVRLAGLKLLAVSHAALLVIVQILLDVTFTVALLAAFVGVQEDADNESVAAAGFWVTVMVRVGAPGAVAVMVPVLAAVPVLAVTFILKEPLPVRLVGMKLLTVSHAALLVIVHVLLEVTFTVALLTAPVGDHEAVDKISIAAAGLWVTATVRVGAPGAVAVIIPVRATVPVLAVTFILNEPLPVRLAGTKLLTVNQAALLVIAQVLFEVTFIVALPAALVGVHPVVDRASVPAAGL